MLTAASIIGVTLWILYEATPANAMEVDGMDGIITVSDDAGNWMTVNASCARVIVDANLPDLTFVHTITASPEYMEACF